MRILLVVLAGCGPAVVSAAAVNSHDAYNGSAAMYGVPLNESSGDPDTGATFFCSTSKFSAKASFCAIDRATCEHVSNEIAARGTNDPVNCFEAATAICFLSHLDGRERTICAPDRDACEFQKLQAQDVQHGPYDFGECVTRRASKRG